MPYVDHLGMRLHYRTEGGGPAVILVHGFTQSCESWFAAGYVDALKDRYQVIVPDLPAHGRSGHPHDEAAYTGERLVGGLTAVMDDAGADKAVYWGYSMGGTVAYRCAAHAPERFAAWVIGAQRPSGVDWPSRFIGPLRQGAQTFVDLFDANQGPLPEGRKAELLAMDAEALACLLAGVRSFIHQDEALAHLTAPTLFYVGELDDNHAAGLPAASARVPGSRLVALPGLNHGRGFSRSRDVLPHIVPFLEAVTRGARTAV